MKRDKILPVSCSDHSGSYSGHSIPGGEEGGGVGGGLGPTLRSRLSFVFFILSLRLLDLRDFFSFFLGGGSDFSSSESDDEEEDFGDFL